MKSVIIWWVTPCTGWSVLGLMRCVCRCGGLYNLPRLQPQGRGYRTRFGGRVETRKPLRFSAHNTEAHYWRQVR
ncbi:hypothetical protein KCP76_07915 [Salmonella enterica subsp. enterica serovar Weltevreden]|nr:hypothetical protein KCP76_07915 [Salmonella enterica subsp. enterica serovar Weltevreden]